jgi:hypothetical protein
MPDSNEASQGLLALWRGLPREHRRWIVLNALLVTAVINVVVNAVIAWVTIRGESNVPLWSVPLVEKPSTITDTVGTFFVLPLVTCLLATTAVWRDRRIGRLPSLGGGVPSHALLSNVPRTRVRRGVRLGAVMTIALAPISVLILVAIDFGGLTQGQFVLYKAALGVALGAAVTPVIALWAMADPLPTLPSDTRKRSR